MNASKKAAVLTSQMARAHSNALNSHKLADVHGSVMEANAALGELLILLSDAKADDAGTGDGAATDAEVLELRATSLGLPRNASPEAVERAELEEAERTMGCTLCEQDRIDLDDSGHMPGCPGAK